MGKTLSPSWMNALVPCHSSTPKSLSKLSVMVYHGIFQPMRAFRRWMSACGARAASHSCGDTILGVFFGSCPFGFSLSLFVLVAILFLLWIFEAERDHSLKTLDRKSTRLNSS